MFSLSDGRLVRLILALDLDLDMELKTESPNSSLGPETCRINLHFTPYILIRYGDSKANEKRGMKLKPKKEKNQFFFL
jgi:hypothetical protein